jgi:hypothetical protein
MMTEESDYFSWPLLLTSFYSAPKAEAPTILSKDRNITMRSFCVCLFADKLSLAFEASQWCCMATVG